MIGFEPIASASKADILTFIQHLKNINFFFT